MPFLGFRARLHASGPLFFAHTVLPEPAVSSILGACGFDFIMVDVEHGPFTLASLRVCVEALSCTGTPVVVRTASHGEVEIKQVLDLGVDGVIVPRVETAEQVRDVVRASRYAPEGTRSVCRAVRASRFGLDELKLSDANARVAVIAIIESIRGVENAQQIVSTAGLDGIMVGGDDLSADLDLFGNYEHPRFQDAVKFVVNCASKVGLKVGAGLLPAVLGCEGMLVGCGNDAIVLGGAFKQVLHSQRCACLKPTA